MNADHIERFLEFMVVGVVFGTVEDLIAVKLATGEPLTLKMVGIVVAVAVPFAAFSELYIDHPEIRPMKSLAGRIEAWMKSAI